MRVVFPTTTIASIGGAVYLATVNAVTDSVSIAYEKPGSIRFANTAATTQQGSECSFEKEVLTMTPDVGVLSCGTGEMCVEDSTSQFGGRCVASEEKLAVESQRELQCTKCSGKNACPVGVNQTKIGCGSCIGDYACFNLPDNVIIGENSCVGDYACFYSDIALDIKVVMVLREAPLAMGAVLVLNLANMVKGLLGTTHVMTRRHVIFVVVTQETTHATGFGLVVKNGYDKDYDKCASESPSMSPSGSPSSVAPTMNPTKSPSSSPSTSPSSSPSASPSAAPTMNPTKNPSSTPSGSPTSSPSASPIISTGTPSISEVEDPSEPTVAPDTASPTSASKPAKSGKTKGTKTSTAKSAKRVLVNKSYLIAFEVYFESTNQEVAQQLNAQSSSLLNLTFDVPSSIVRRTSNVTTTPKAKGEKAEFNSNSSSFEKETKVHFSNFGNECSEPFQGSRCSGLIALDLLMLLVLLVC
eukprot:scaffold68079_cov66-Cyclotella_meneghiniana.AAC.1